METKPAIVIGVALTAFAVAVSSSFVKPTPAYERVVVSECAYQAYRNDRFVGKHDDLALLLTNESRLRQLNTKYASQCE